MTPLPLTTLEAPPYYTRLNKLPKDFQSIICKCSLQYPLMKHIKCSISQAFFTLQSFFPESSWVINVSGLIWEINIFLGLPLILLEDSFLCHRNFEPFRFSKNDNDFVVSCGGMLFESVIFCNIIFFVIFL